MFRYTCAICTRAVFPTGASAMLFYHPRNSRHVCVYQRKIVEADKVRDHGTGATKLDHSCHVGFECDACEIKSASEVSP